MTQQSCDPTEQNTSPQPTSGTVAKDEIARFAKISDQWWNTEGKFRALHELNPLRTKFIRDHIARHFKRDPLEERPLRGLRVLDIGCGGGLLAEPMSRLGAHVTGIDAGATSISIARSHATLMGLQIDYRHYSPELLANDGEIFDVVLAMEVVEHVADLSEFLSISSALIQPKGAFFLSTLNRTLKSLALAKLAAEYILRWVPAGTHDWRKFQKPSELAAYLRPLDVHVQDLKGMTYSPMARTTSKISPSLASNSGE